MTTPLRVLVADERRLMREVLVALIRQSPALVALAPVGSQREVLRALPLRPEVLVMHATLPGGPLAALISEVRAHAAGVRVVLVGDDAAAQEASIARTFADATLTWADTSNELIHQVIGLSSKSVPGRRLSRRQAEVIALVAAGLSNRQIAQRLFLAPGTVKRHLSDVFSRLDARSRVDAINKAVALGEIDPRFLRMPDDIGP